MRKILIAPSILSADFSKLSQEIKAVESAGADLIHIDIMDGHFVPNLTFGPKLVKDLRKETRLPLDVHLMIENPLKFIDRFLEAGSDWISLHIETLKDDNFFLAKRKVKRYPCKLGLVLNPNTPLEKILPFVSHLDFVLVMSVFPGFGGQGFMPEVLDKIGALRKIFQGDIAVDGGINNETSRLVIEKGANVLCAGSFIFGSADYAESIKSLRESF